MIDNNRQLMWFQTTIFNNTELIVYENQLSTYLDALQYPCQLLCILQF